MKKDYLLPLLIGCVVGFVLMSVYNGYMQKEKVMKQTSKDCSKEYYSMMVGMSASWPDVYNALNSVVIAEKMDSCEAIRFFETLGKVKAEKAQ